MEKNTYTWSGKYLSYYVGDSFNIKNFDMEYNVECGAGIHFLRTEEEAKRYTNLI